MQDIIFQIPKRVEIGFSKSEQVGEIVEELGISRLLVVVDNNLMKLGLIDSILALLKDSGISFSIFDEIKGEPTIDEIDQAIKKLNIANRFDGIIGIGGGSTLDTAKLLAVANSVEDSVKEFIGKKITEPGLPTIMIPTTSGTGSEATPNAIVKNVEENIKLGLIGPALIPKAVILDPELTISLPPKITAETGIDAFTHAIECFICNKANEMSDLYALEGIRLISKYLPLAVKNGENKEARYKMILGSFYGGVAITNSGTGAVHALAYPLGGKYGVSHGLSNAILLADVMEFNSSAVPDKFVRVAEKMGIKRDGLSTGQIVVRVVEAIKDLTREVGIKVDTINIAENDIEDLAKSAMTVERLLNNNPRLVEYKDAKRIYKKVFVD
ncbi:iron-containing alcohol dehydrogenase [Halocella sp. SP3-1]|uniref:iron-containing alcohol dehydrogenase n=1 Tax=Halocella sp. SP3-1 TaxID=2382161 RepID=UPI000F74D3B7|nr:iron-containing alcohol dehydrogenase [Halocella sp. SP3-1]AZO93516.1 iron-containing alcohol dehydrogenase [Halocella sp. SP3-1]